MSKIKHSTTTEISFEKVDAEMFRRTIIDYAKELYKEYEESKKKVMELKKKIIASKKEEKFNQLQSDVFWEAHRGSDAIEKIRLMDYILQELGFKLTDFGSIKPDIEEKLKTGGT